MAYESSDGKKFTNRPPMMAHNKSLSRMQGKSEADGAGLMEKSDPLAQPGQEGGGEEQEGSQIAAEHGPATDVMMHHDHEGGMHEVHSMHPDGHEHHSTHESAEKAHEHGKKLAGAHQESEMGNQDEEEQPEYE